jgi:hypothetical protein
MRAAPAGRSAIDGARPLQGAADRVVGGGHGGAQHGGGAMAGVGARHGGAGVAALHDVDAGRAMHVQVDEAGQDGQLAAGGGGRGSAAADRLHGFDALANCRLPCSQP